MPQIHLRAEEGDYAPLVLLPGDPNRARRISERFDEGSVRTVNEHRGLFGFTGTYHGVPVSVQTSGMGTPSLSIVVEELLRLGATRLIRVGTCGGIGKGLKTGDLVVATAACPTDGSTRTYLHGDAYAPAADFGLTRAIVDAAAAAGIEAWTGLIASVDVFYNPDEDYAKRWRERGVLALEMEASALFFLAARAGVKAACALTVSDVLSEEVSTEETYLPLDELDRAIDRMIDVALDAGTAEGRLDRMTDTLSRGAANQAGAIVNPNAADEAQDFLPLKGIDHVEFWVGNAKQAAHYYRALWGFTPVAYAGLETGVRDRSSFVMVQNEIRFVFTAPISPDGEIAEHVARHGDGVKDIAFAVDDVASAWRETTSRGAISALEPTDIEGKKGTLRRSSIHAYGEVVHSFVDRSDYHGAFAPGYHRINNPAPAATGQSLLEIDHCVGNVELGDMNRFVNYYRDVLGFAQLIHYDDKVIHTDYSALMSKVMTNGNGRIKFPINEPAAGKKKSQIQEFLDYYLDAGTQHIALRTEDIVGTVRALRERGVEFLGMPHAYYESLPDRVGDVGVPIDLLEELGIEADRDEEGYLLQIFTRPVQDRPTFFFEIIERHGSRGFGVGNFKALFEAIEIEQARRGNL